MGKPIRWLHEEIDRWVNSEIITGAQAARLREIYPFPGVATPWGMIIFSGLGAALVGLGVILLFAYNWHAIPRYGKLAVIFGFLAAAHAGNLILIRRPGWQRQLGEALAVLGTMLFGSGIWLIAQIYNINEHFPNGFLIWALGALALGWAVYSIPQGVIAAVLLCIWSCSEAGPFDTPVPWAPLLLCAGVGGLAWRTRSLFLLTLTAIGLYVMLLVNAANAVDAITFGAGLALGVFFVATSMWARHTKAWPSAAPVLQFLGYGGFLIITYILSFSRETHHLLNWTERSHVLPDLVCYGWIPFGLAMLAWVGWFAYWLSRRQSEGPPLSPEWLLLPGALLAAQIFGFSDVAHDDFAVMAGAIFNLVLLALAGVWMARGCRQGLLWPTVTGSLLLVALATARYFDLFESLLARGTVFLFVGVILFVEGFFYRRARRQHSERRELQ